MSVISKSNSGGLFKASQTTSRNWDDQDMYQREEREHFAECGKRLARRAYDTEIRECNAYDDSLGIHELERLISEELGSVYHLTPTEANDVIRKAIDQARKSY